MDSKDGFQSSVWGPAAWMFLHFVAQNYTPSRKKAYHTFFKLLGDILPCKYCRDNYRCKIKKSLKPSVFENRTNFSKWLFKLHNMVRLDTGSKLKYANTDVGFRKAVKFYERYRVSDRTKCVKFRLKCTIIRKK
jgi:hypothetical protein